MGWVRRQLEQLYGRAKRWFSRVGALATSNSDHSRRALERRARGRSTTDKGSVGEENVEIQKRPHPQLGGDEKKDKKGNRMTGHSGQMMAHALAQSQAPI